MPKLEWYNFKSGLGLPIHAEWSPIDRAIYIRSDDPDIEPHVAIAHEMAHYTKDLDSSFGGEVEAWEEAIYSLMKVGEWTKEAREQMVWALTGDRENFEGEARWWIKRAEDRARKRLRKE